MSKPSLEKAYNLKTLNESRQFYQAWADSYDQSFGVKMGYVAPRNIAQIYAQESHADDRPLLDVGAGTGLIAEHLPGGLMDALDLSPDMLRVAQGKGLYRATITADVTKPLDIADNTYGGVISSGTFTHGHVGPECLPELLRITRPGGLFVCGCVPKVYDGMGFGSTLAGLVAQNRITPVRFHDVPIYENAEHDHATDRVLVMVFRTV